MIIRIWIHKKETLDEIIEKFPQYYKYFIPYTGFKQPYLKCLGRFVLSNFTEEFIRQIEKDLFKYGYLNQVLIGNHFYNITTKVIENAS